MDIEKMSKLEKEKWPTYSTKSRFVPLVDILETVCCSNYCNMRITLLDCLQRRTEYINYFLQNPGMMKHQARQKYFSELMIINNKPTTKSQACLTLLSALYGITINCLLNYASGDRPYVDEIKRISSKTIENISDGLVSVASHAQYNPTGGIILPSAFKISGSDGRILKVSTLRKKTKLKIRQRKKDTLVRCSHCCSLLNEKHAKTEFSKLASNYLDAHYKDIGTERIIARTVEKLSRQESTDLLVFSLDAMSNRQTKLPITDTRSRTVGDVERLGTHLVTLQISRNYRCFEFSNLEYLTIDGKYRMNSSYYASLIINGLLEIDKMPSHLIFILDNCLVNKSEVFVGTLGLLLAKLKHVHKITLLYPTVGHTHGHVDGHFGSLSTFLQTEKCGSTRDFRETLAKIPSVKSVQTGTTIFNFQFIKDKLVKWKYRTDNHQLVLVKGEKDCIYWSTAAKMSTGNLFSLDSVEMFPLFVKGFSESDCYPPLTRPDAENICSSNVNRYISNMGAFLTTNQKNDLYEDCCETGRDNFHALIQKINRIPEKNPNMIQSRQPTETITQFLEDLGYPVAKDYRLPVRK